MEVAEASKAEKQQKLAGIMESMCACKSKLEESRSSMACLKGLVGLPFTHHTCNPHTV